MTGRRNTDKPADRSDQPRKAGGNAPKPKPALPADDDLYDTGDIAAPQRDRDDEQRDL